MSDLIKLTHYRDTKESVIINLDHVVTIFENDPGSEIVYTTGKRQFVNETLDQILLLRGKMS